MANYTYVSTSGTVIPDTGDVMADVVAEYKAALGDDIVTTPDTPQGLLIAAEVSARKAVLNNNAQVANQINPNLSGGVFLDAICALMGLSRTTSTQSTAICTVTGVVGTIVGTSVRFKSTTGDVWEVISAVVIPTGNTIDVAVRSVDYGPIAAASGAINQIYVGAIGLETVTNTDAATLGELSQSDASLKALRKVSLGLQGINGPEHVLSAIYNVTGVTSATFRENIQGTTQVIDGITMVENSIYACVDGGSDNDVANALLRKSFGCAFNGSTSVTVTNQSSAQDYTVLFDRPTGVDIFIRVTCKTTSILVDPNTTVINAVLAYAAGNVPGMVGFIVGASVSPFEVAGAINVTEPSIFVSKVEISDDTGAAFSTNVFPIAINEKALITADRIIVLSA